MERPLPDVLRLRDGHRGGVQVSDHIWILNQVAFGFVMAAVALGLLLKLGAL